MEKFQSLDDPEPRWSMIQVPVLKGNFLKSRKFRPSSFRYRQVSLYINSIRVLISQPLNWKEKGIFCLVFTSELFIHLLY